MDNKKNLIVTFEVVYRYTEHYMPIKEPNTKYFPFFLFKVSCLNFYSGITIGQT